MKKLYFLILICAATLTSKAQYQFTKLTDQTYQEITDPTYIIYDTTIYWANVLTKPDMFFKAFGKEYDLMDGISIPLKEGYFFIQNATRSTTVYACKGSYDGRPGKKQQSTFSFKTETSGTKKIFIAQWKNLGFKNGDSTDFINFQARLAEDGERIELHFGPSSVKNGLYEDGANGPTIGLLEMDQTFSTIYNQLWLSGAPKTPVVVNTNDVINLDGTPPNGTTYIFAYGTAGIKKNESIIGSNIYSAYVMHDKIKINWQNESSGNHEIIITDLKGVTVYTGKVNSNDAEISHFLSSGLYSLTILSNNSYYNRKIFIP